MLLVVLILPPTSAKPIISISTSRKCRFEFNSVIKQRATRTKKKYFRKSPKQH